MADVRESFTTLEGASQEGLALRAVQQGDSIAAKNGSIAFAFKDNSGNAIAAIAGVAVGAAPTTAIPALVATDTAGNLETVPVAVAGDAPGNAIPVLGFLDSTGNLIAPTLSAAGEVPVVGPLTDAELRASPVPVTFGTVTGDGKKVRGTIAGNASLTTVASLTLVTSKIYENLDFIVSCFRDCRFQVILSDNGSETILADALCDPGAFSFHANFGEMEIATGATGTQLLLIKGINLNALSDMYAALSVKLAN